MTLVGAFSVIVKIDCGTDGSVYSTRRDVTLYTLRGRPRLARYSLPDWGECERGSPQVSVILMSRLGGWGGGSTASTGARLPCT